MGTFAEHTDEKKKKKRSFAEFTSERKNVPLEDLTKYKTDVEDLAPIKTTSQKPSAGAVASGILGAKNPMDMTMDEIKQEQSTLKWYEVGKNTQYQSAYNQKLIEKNTELLKNTYMGGTNHSVYDEMQAISKIEDKEKKEKRKAVVLKKMQELGIATEDYALYTDDKNFSWGAFFDWLGSSANKGLHATSKGLVDTAYYLLGKPQEILFPGTESPLKEMSEYYNDLYEQVSYNTELKKEKLGGGKGYDYGGMATETITAAVPNAVATIMSGGTNLMAQGSTMLGSNATIMQSNNILAKAGLTLSKMIKNPHYWISFAQTFGNDVREAEERGVPDSVAYLGGTISSLINAGIEIGIDGGSGIQGIPDKVLDGLKKGEKKFFFNWLESMGQEGSEEVLQGIVNNLVSYTTYDRYRAEDEPRTKVFDAKQMGQEFVLGAGVGGVLGGGQIAVTSAINSTQNFLDSQLTSTEKQVVDAVYEQRVKAKEKEVGNLSNREKNDIYNKVVSDLEKGFLNIEDIEDALGGDDYSRYKEIDDREAELIATIEKSEGDPRAIAKRIGEEARKELEALRNGTERADLRTKMSQNAIDMAKGTRLAETYNEKARRYEALDVDLSEYSGKMRETMQKAMDSGILNNTNRTKDFVKFIGHISEKGINFDFTNNEALRKSGFVVDDGVTINGLVQGTDIVLNTDSAKALESVVGHEVAHILQEAGFSAEIKDVVFEYSNAKGDFNARWESIQKLYKDRFKGTEEEIKAKMEEELVADLVGDYIFSDVDFVMNLHTKNPNLFKRVFDEIKYMYRVATAGSEQAAKLEEAKRVMEKVWRGEIGGTSTDQRLSMSSMAQTFYGNENMSLDDLKKRDYKETEGYKSFEEKMLNNMRQSRPDFDEVKAREEIANVIDGLFDVGIASKEAGYDILDDGKARDVRDSKKRLLFSSLEPNSEYFTSSDISTICDKSKNFQQIYDDIIRRETEKGVPDDKRFFNNVDNYFYIHRVMAEKGLTQPCRQCYVDSMRKNLSNMAYAFRELIQETDVNNITNPQLYNDGKEKKNNKRIRKGVLDALSEYGMSAEDITFDMLTTEEGLAQLRLQAPLVYEAFNSFYGQSKPKMPKEATPYRFGELTALLTKADGTINKKLIDKINHTGGFRMQSYSDFQIQNYVDVLQVLFEAGTLGLRGHAYTKVPNFLIATDGTNLKRNISIFMYQDGNEWKIDRNDSFPYPLEDIYKIVQDDKAGNTSIIAVIQNDEMAAWVMANDYVGQGIPFHKSGQKMDTVRSTIVKEGGREILGYSNIKDHTKHQSETYARTVGKKSEGTKVSKPIDMYEFWDFDNKEGLSKNDLIKKNLEAYIDACEKAGYKPKFSDYITNKDGILQKTLAYAKELGFVSQDATIEDISFEYKGYQIPYGYYKVLGDFGMFTPDGQASSQEVLSLKDYQFSDAVKFFKDKNALHRKEILQQFANGEERTKYENSDLTTEELQEVIKQKRQEVVDEIVPRFSLSDSDGNALTKEQQDFFKDSKVRDDAGNLMVVYHGTKDFGFTKFDTSKSDDGSSLFFTNDINMANSYVNDKDKIYKTYLNIKNPYVVDAKGHKWNQIRLGENQDAITGKVERYVDLSMRYDVEIDFSTVSESLGSLVESTEYFLQDDEANTYEDGEPLFNESEREELLQLAKDIDEAYENWDEDAHLDEDGEPMRMQTYLLDHQLSTKYTTRQISKIAKEEGHDGVIIKNVYDNGKHSSDTGIHGFGNVYIAFDSNQVKTVDNQNPTEDTDIRYSMSGKTYLQDQGTHWNDILKQDIAPMPETQTESAPVEAPIVESAPVVAEGEVVENKPIETAEDKYEATVKALQTELEKNRQYRSDSYADYTERIENAQAKYDAKKDKNSKVANDLLRSIERMKRLRDSNDANYEKRINDLEGRIGKMEEDASTIKTAIQRKAKQQEYFEWAKNLLGDTSTWKDKKLGLQYEVNTQRRNLRDIVRDASGKQDIAKADVIDDALEGAYDHNEAALKRESREIKQPYADKKITRAEDKYIHMFGELRYNPETELTEDIVDEYYEKHKKKIDKAKVDQIIEDSRNLYDSLFERLNAKLREQGMKEIPYRQGYFPHMKTEKQSLLGKLFNWKTIDNEIPTDIAGLTEAFNPNKSWQSFAQRRRGDKTEYSFTKGFDAYIHGALDWIYHIEDIQKRRAIENYIRYIHSDAGIKEQIDAINKNEEYDADEVWEQINLVYANADNPLNNFIVDFRTKTNTLANKKSTMDREIEKHTNRKIYSTMSNISNRVTGNMVAGSISSALTNFIPITQSWGQVSPVSSLRAMRDTIKSAIKDDGMIDKSDFLTNRLRGEENLNVGFWDYVNQDAMYLMETVDSFTSQVVWRSKYLENISKGMSENTAIQDADQFAKSVMAGRSRGNMPTIFDSKNPLIKMATAFQLEVNNQYGYMFKDMPRDMQNEAKSKLAKGYALMFLGAYGYNALYSSLTGRDTAFDPISIIEDLLKDLGVLGDDDDEEEKASDVLFNLGDNILDEMPFISGFTGGGRIPISSMLPYGEGIGTTFTETIKDVEEGNWETLTKEWLNPVYYLAMPVGGGQIRKTVQGLQMFSEDHPISGSYTDSGALRFPVEDTPMNRVKAALFGQYSSKNARDYFDRGEAPLKEKQIQEFIDLDMPINDYWDYRDGLSERKSTKDKISYIVRQDVPDDKKNIMVNNAVDRKEEIDISDYEYYADFEEFDYYSKNETKYNFLKDNGISYKEYKKADRETKKMYDSAYTWAKENPKKVVVAQTVATNVVEYRQYTSALDDIYADKDADGQSIPGSAKEKKIQYINSLPIDDGQKYILFRMMYDGKEDRNYYNPLILDYLNSREDLSYEDRVTILQELDFEVFKDGSVRW